MLCENVIPYGSLGGSSLWTVAEPFSYSLACQREANTGMYLNSNISLSIQECGINYLCTVMRSDNSSLGIPIKEYLPEPVRFSMKIADSTRARSSLFSSEGVSDSIPNASWRPAPIANSSASNYVIYFTQHLGIQYHSDI